MLPANENRAASGRKIGGVSLNQRFLAAIVIILACSLALGLGLIVHYQRNLTSSRTSLSQVLAFRDVLEAANRLSAERGPANAVLGEDPQPGSPSRRRLQAFRVESDASLLRAVARLPRSAAMRELQERFAEARRQVDRLSALPLRERTDDAIAQVVGGMFGVFDASQPVIDAAMTELLADDPDLVGRALIARMLSELREHAGRLGSHLVIPMAHGDRVDANRRAAFEQTRGRVLELWHLLRQPVGASRDPAVIAAYRAVNERFFGDGMALLDKTLAIGLAGQFSQSTAAFTDAIVPTFKPLEELREAFLDAMIAELRAQGYEAQRALTVAVVATALVLGVELLLLVASQTLLFRPLLDARGRILALAAGNLGAPPAKWGMLGEIRSLFQALETLRIKLIEHEALDRERASLTRQLKVQAETDGLTGVLNRGALERLAEQLTQADAATQQIGLILLDLDHFKAVNDSHGHSAGDEVLKETARRLRAALRLDDVVARFGGEEFAILLLDEDGEAPLDIAERLRSTLLNAPFVLPSGESVAITASFGVARAASRAGVWPQLVSAADHALYRAKASGRNCVTQAA